MKQHETVQILKEAIECLPHDKMTYRMDELSTIVNFIEKLQPGSASTIKNLLPFQLRTLSEDPLCDKETFLKLCEQNPKMSLRIAGDKWAEVDPASFLEACFENPTAALQESALAWYNLQPDECVQRLEAHMPNKIEDIADQLLKDDPERLVAFCESHLSYAFEACAAQWATADPKSYVERCHNRYSSTLQYKEATLIWKELDEKGCQQAFKEVDLLMGIVVAPEILALIAQNHPEKAKEALLGLSYVDACLNYPGLWWELDPETMIDEATRNVWASTMTVPYLTVEMKDKLRDALRERPDLTENFNGYELLQALEIGVWEEETLSAAVRNTLSLLLSSSTQEQDREYHQAALLWEIDKAREMDEARELDMLEHVGRTLLNNPKTGSLDTLVENLPEYPGYSLEKKLEGIQENLEKYRTTPERYRTGLMAEDLETIALTIETADRNKELMVENVKTIKSSLRGGAGSLVAYLLDDKETRELTQYILDTPGMNTDTLSWALERAGNLNTQPTVRIKKNRNGGLNEGITLT